MAKERQRDRKGGDRENKDRQTCCPYPPPTTALTVPHGGGNGQE